MLIPFLNFTKFCLIFVLNMNNSFVKMDMIKIGTFVISYLFAIEITAIKYG